MAEKKKFYRSNLATIVWNPKTNSELANFQKGFFITDDPETIEVLKAKGYMEIPLDMDEPPHGVIIRQPTHIIEGEVPILGPNIGEKLGEQIVNSKLKKQGGIAPPLRKDSREEKPVEEKSITPNSRATKTKTPIKRPTRKPSGSGKIKRRKEPTSNS